MPPDAMKLASIGVSMRTTTSKLTVEPSAFVATTPVVRDAGKPSLTSTAETA